MGKVQKRGQRELMMADDADRGWFAAPTRRLGYHPRIWQATSTGGGIYVHVRVSLHFISGP